MPWTVADYIYGPGSAYTYDYGTGYYDAGTFPVRFRHPNHPNDPGFSRWEIDYQWLGGPGPRYVFYQNASPASNTYYYNLTDVPNVESNLSMYPNNADGNARGTTLTKILA